MTDSRNSTLLWSVVILGLVGLVIWQSLDFFRPPVQARVIAVGDELPEVILDRWHLDVDSRQLKGKSTSSRALFGGRCGVVIFFEATCRGCEVIAPKWTAMRQIEKAGRRIEVAWISLKTNDTAQARFVHEFGVGPSWLAFRSVQDRRRMGVMHWPSVLVLDMNGKVASIDALTPDLVEIPDNCPTLTALGQSEPSITP